VAKDAALSMWGILVDEMLSSTSSWATTESLTSFLWRTAVTRVQIPAGAFLSSPNPFIITILLIHRMVKTYRIKSSDFKVYESSGGQWKKSPIKFQTAIVAAQLFKAHKNLSLIKDPKNPKFLKGSYSNRPLGARINVLPNGERLTKAYSIFSQNLTIHDEQSNTHWDAIFQNPSGEFAYSYTLKKEISSNKKKYKKVEEFKKCLPKLKRNLTKALGTEPLVLPMIILLKTKMRIGNEVYYNKNHHKGLTTLKKHDVKISNNKVTFSYIAKDGVPQKITEQFPVKVVKELKKLLSKKKSNDFIFTGRNKHPLKDSVFERAFEKYCGVKFYPHIVRSHFATEKVQSFLKNKKKINKEDVRKLYNSIAEKLGHKKFSKEKNEWQTSYTVTLHHYIQPELVEKITKSQ
jgi:hypothetical protein